MDVPVGVATLLGAVEQPAITPSDANKIPSIARTRNPASCFLCRASSSEPNGNNRAARIPAPFHRPLSGYINELILFSVMIDTVVVAGAFGVTTSWEVEKPHVAPAGRPLQLRFTVPAKELLGATLNVT